MSLLSTLAGNELVDADEELGLIFVWHGGPVVHVLNEDGAYADEFRIGTAYERKLTRAEVVAAIATYEQELRAELA